jgi:hypothetical protein
MRVDHNDVSPTALGAARVSFEQLLGAAADLDPELEACTVDSPPPKRTTPGQALI